MLQPRNSLESTSNQNDQSKTSTGRTSQILKSNWKDGQNIPKSFSTNSAREPSNLTEDEIDLRDTNCAIPSKDHPTSQKMR